MRRYVCEVLKYRYELPRDPDSEPTMVAWCDQATLVSTSKLSAAIEYTKQIADADDERVTVRVTRHEDKRWQQFSVRYSWHAEPINTYLY